MKILMIGGTGVISTEVSKRLIETGFDLTLMNRGTQSRGICPDGAEVICDGDTSAELHPGDRIRISRSASRTRLIKLQQTSFVEILRKKMN